MRPVVSLLLLTGAILSGQKPLRFCANAKESALGAQLAAEAQRSMKVLDDAELTARLEHIVKRLQGSKQDCSWTVTAIRDAVGGSTHEPLTFIGERFFVPAALIPAVANEDELAGMLAHAMSHPVILYNRPRPARGQLSGGSPVVFFAGWLGFLPGSDDRASTIPIKALETHRAEELEADRMALRLMADAGYRPAALLDYISRTQRDLPAEDRKYSALPPGEERIPALETALKTLVGRAFGLPPAFRPACRVPGKNSCELAVSFQSLPD